MGKFNSLECCVKKRKICVVTGTRAEYGLLYWLLKAINKDKDLELQLIVTGMHLSPDFGLTYKEIEKDFHIDKKIEILSGSDTSVSISNSMGIAHICFGSAYEELKPDLLVVLGDRYEILMAVSAAMIARIPIAHIHGGETTEGAVDEVIRHAITKMSHLHFCATKVYRKRIIQLGENPKRVFNVGGIGIDNIKNLDLLTKKEFEKSIDFKLKKRNVLVTFHPVTLEKNSAQKQLQALFDALDTLQDTAIIFTKANSDMEGRTINSMIDAYVTKNSTKAVAFASLGQLRYLSALSFVDGVVGNSSSGLLEAPTFKIGTINIGTRQKGRIKAKSVIDCKPNKRAIIEAFDTLYSDEFQKSLHTLRNPYGEGGATKKIKKIIKKVDLDTILQKKFFDIEMDEF